MWLCYVPATNCSGLLPTYETGRPRLFPQPPCFTGTLTPIYANLSRLTKLDFYTSNLNGPLPEIWAQPGVFTSLSFLRLSFNNASGSLPASWGNPGAFPKLRWDNGSMRRVCVGGLISTSSCVVTRS